MDQLFLDSLLEAVSGFIGTLAVGSEATQFGEGGDEVARALAELGDHPLVLANSGPMGIQQIREHDPDFDLSAFLVRVGEMFSAYHEALDRGDLKPVRRFVDERSFAALEQAAQTRGRNPDGPRALTVKAIRPVTATHEADLDMVRVLISAKSSGDAETICEYWELVRKQGVLSKAGLDLTHCPNCGGPVNGDDPTRCAYCGTRLADPAYDWVVRKITAQ